MGHFRGASVYPVSLEPENLPTEYRGQLALWAYMPDVASRFSKATRATEWFRQHEDRVLSACFGVILDDLFPADKPPVRLIVPIGGVTHTYVCALRLYVGPLAQSAGSSLTVALTGWSADIAEVWQLGGLLASTTTARPCIKCLLRREHIHGQERLPMSEQRARAATQPRTVLAARHWLEEAFSKPSVTAAAEHARQWALRLNKPGSVMQNRAVAFDFFQGVGMDRLHVLYKGLVADWIDACTTYVDSLGADKADKLNDAINQLPSFPTLLQMRAYQGRTHTAKVYETLLQVWEWRCPLACDGTHQLSNRSCRRVSLASCRHPTTRS